MRVAMTEPRCVPVPFRWALASIALLSGCYRAPRFSGSDQVYDPNVEATIQKDNGLAAMSWDPVDDYMEDLIGDLDDPGCAIGVARGGNLIYLDGYGKAELGGEDWSVGTVGAVGSVSKTFTAAAALRMHQLGMVNVNLTVGHYLPTGNDELDGVSVWQLLAHSSGVGGGTKGAAFSPSWEDGDAADCLYEDDAACQQLNRDLASPATAFLYYEGDEAVAELDPGDPGDGIPAEGVYSNVGYSVAGAVVDHVASGTPSLGYEAWIWDHIGQYTGNVLDGRNLLTLALSHSWRASDIPHRAVGYRPVGNAFTEREAFDLDVVDGLEGWQGPSGGWAMTIGDLTRFAVALNTSENVSPASLAAMRLRWTDLDEISNDHGMGVMLGDAGQPPYWHGGIIGGHTAAWTWWDSYQGGPSLSINLLCNREDMNPFNLRDHAAIIAGRIGSSSPVPPIAGVLPGVSPGAVDGQRYALDDSGAWQVEPSGAFLPLAALRHIVLLDIAAGSSTIALTLGEGNATASGVVLAPGRPRQSLGQVSFRSNPRFATGPVDVTLMTAGGALLVRGFVVEGAFDRQGAGMTRVQVRGTLDARQAAPLFGSDHEEICRDVAAAGAQCRPCADGFPACVTVGYRGVTGNRIAPR